MVRGRGRVERGGEVECGMRAPRTRTPSLPLVLSQRGEGAKEAQSGEGAKEALAPFNFNKVWFGVWSSFMALEALFGSPPLKPLNSYHLTVPRSADKGPFTNDVTQNWGISDPPPPSITLLCPRSYKLMSHKDPPPSLRDIICECSLGWTQY